MKNIIIAIIILFCASMHAQVQMEVDGDLKIDAKGNYTKIQIGEELNTAIYADNDYDSDWHSGGMWFRVHNEINNPTAPIWDQYIDALMITTAGNVGIGINNPNEKLVVDGTIKAKEVIITTALTADFVFADDYTLRPLDEVEAFVNSNNHLPEVPSAKEMEDNGVGVAQMNQLLLQKVEELTLYMIELKKQNESLADDVEVLKAKVQ